MLVRKLKKSPKRWTARRAVQKSSSIGGTPTAPQRSLTQAHSSRPDVAKRTVARALEEEGYEKYRAKRKPKLNRDVA
ncbi:hypothetical protein AG0111_0g12073 [Alternaria gaisen]|uniref:Uncharacterized protein n=1 Tax=Alternaria gaisen TaxID=167740 RepID=A0ACB6F599_9PLEO|nr:hypothetical protein AG0111_0g12073 [Alternaria gaisen]